MGGFLFFTTPALILTFSSRLRRFGATITFWRRRILGGPRPKRSNVSFRGLISRKRRKATKLDFPVKSESGDRRRDVNIPGETLNLIDGASLTTSTTQTKWSSRSRFRRAPPEHLNDEIPMTIMLFEHARRPNTSKIPTKFVSGSPASNDNSNRPARYVF